MANRVVIDANGIKISKPGFNALTAGLAGLNFDSKYPAFSVHMRGQITGWGNQTISFGKTFPTPPMVAFDRVFSGNVVPMGGLGGFGFFYRQEVEDIDGMYIGDNQATATAIVGTSSISYSAQFIKVNSGTPNPPTLTFRYTVFDYNL